MLIYHSPFNPLPLQANLPSEAVSRSMTRGDIVAAMPSLGLPDCTQAGAQVAPGKRTAPSGIKRRIGGATATDAPAPA